MAFQSENDINHDELDCLSRESTPTLLTPSAKRGRRQERFATAPPSRAASHSRSRSPRRESVHGSPRRRTPQVRNISLGEGEIHSVERRDIISVADLNTMFPAVPCVDHEALPSTAPLSQINATPPLDGGPFLPVTPGAPSQWSDEPGEIGPLMFPFSPEKYDMKHLLAEAIEAAAWIEQQESFEGNTLEMIGDSIHRILVACMRKELIAGMRTSQLTTIPDLINAIHEAIHESTPPPSDQEMEGDNPAAPDDSSRTPRAPAPASIPPSVPEEIEMLPAIISPALLESKGQWKEAGPQKKGKSKKNASQGGKNANVGKEKSPPKSQSLRRCSGCGNTGHIVTNANCPAKKGHTSSQDPFQRSNAPSPALREVPSGIRQAGSAPPVSTNTLSFASAAKGIKQSLPPPVPIATKPKGTPRMVQAGTKSARIVDAYNARAQGSMGNSPPQQSLLSLNKDLESFIKNMAVVMPNLTVGQLTNMWESLEKGKKNNNTTQSKGQRVKYTTKGPSRKQVLISNEQLGTIQVPPFKDIVDTVNRGLTFEKSRLRVESARQAYNGISLITTAVASPQDIAIINKWVQKALQSDKEIRAGLPQSRSYLKVVNVPFFLTQDMGSSPTPSVRSRNPITSEDMMRTIDDSPLKELFVLSAKPRVVRNSPKADNATVWIDIWDSQKGTRAKGLIGRTLYINGKACDIKPAQVHAGVPQCAICWRWGHMAINCRCKGAKCPRCYEPHSEHNHRDMAGCCKGNLKANPPIPPTVGIECPHSFKCINCQGAHGANATACPFWKNRFNKQWITNKNAEIRAQILSRQDGGTNDEQL